MLWPSVYNRMVPGLGVRLLEFEPHYSTGQFVILGNPCLFHELQFPHVGNETRIYINVI